MKKQFSVDYKGFSGKEKSLDFEVDQDTIDKIKQMAQPGSFLKQGATIGAKGLLAFIIITFLFAAVNLSFLVTAIVEIVSNGMKDGYLRFVLIAFGAFFFLLTAIGKAYSYVIIKSIHAIYQQSAPLMRKICGAMVDEAADQYETKLEGKAVVSKPVDFIKIYGGYTERFSGLLKRGLKFVLKLVPFSKFITEAHELIKSDRAQATEYVYAKTDAFLNDSVFARNNYRWVLWMLPLNFLIQWAFAVTDF